VGVNVLVGVGVFVAVAVGVSLGVGVLLGVLVFVGCGVGVLVGGGADVMTSVRSPTDRVALFVHALTVTLWVPWASVTGSVIGFAAFDAVWMVLFTIAFARLSKEIAT